eukprot:1320033-Rhodomonas_salina.1
MSDNPVNRERSRHIDTCIHCVRELVNDCVLKLHKVPGTDNVADALTKIPTRCSRSTAMSPCSSSKWGERERLGVMSRSGFRSSAFLRGGRVWRCRPDPPGGERS